MKYKLKFHEFFGQWYIAYRTNGKRVPSTKVSKICNPLNESLAAILSNWFMYEETGMKVCNKMNKSDQTEKFNNKINELIK